MKPISLAEKAVIKKDFHEVWDSKMARETLLIVPIVLVVLIPIMFLVLIMNVPTSQVNGIDTLMKMIPKEMSYMNIKQFSFYVMSNVMFPMFFLMIPLMTSTVAAASSFVGEKERHTLETLVLTPMSMQKIFRAKVASNVLLSAIVTTISFLIFSMVISVGDIMLGLPFFLNWSWLVCILFFAPAVTVFGVVFIVLASAKSKSYIEAVQTSGYIVIPLILLFIGQFMGLFVLNAVVLLLISLGIIAIDIIIMLLISHSFRMEKLLN